MQQLVFDIVSLCVM